VILQFEEKWSRLPMERNLKEIAEWEAFKRLQRTCAFVLGES